MKSLITHHKSTVTGNLGPSPIAESNLNIRSSAQTTAKLQDALAEWSTPSNFVEEERLHWSSQLNLQISISSPVLVSSS